MNRFKKLLAGPIKYGHCFQRQSLSERRNLIRGTFLRRYAVSYPDLEEMMAECGVQVDRTTLNLWVVKYSPDITKAAQARKQATAVSWRMPSQDIALQ